MIYNCTMKDIEIICKIRILQNTELSKEDRLLIKKAKDAAKISYAPYSKFHVGAAVRLADGTLITGNNQENAAYPSGLCAERTTLFYANANHPDLAVTELAIAAYTNGKYLRMPITPCGSCLQVMLETEQRFNHTIRILLYGTEKTYEITGVKNLLPLQFCDESLNG